MGSAQARALLQRARQGAGTALASTGTPPGLDYDSDDATGTEALQSFMALRFPTTSSESWRRKQGKAPRRNRQARAKTLKYEKLDIAARAGLDDSRKNEWANYKRFEAVRVISRTEGESLIAQGAEVIPMQWIETDKNEHLRRPGGPPVPPRYRSRMVSMGNHETADLRSDSPTVSTEGQNLIFSFAASHKVKVNSLDITNAYFQGERLQRTLLLRQPRGGVPDPEVSHDSFLLARVPIYGTRDAGRGFWKRLRSVAVGAGLRESKILPAFYSYADGNGKVIMVLGSHVDDILWANLPEANHVMENIMAQFEVGTAESMNFRYCGKEVAQDDDYNIVVTCRSTSLKLTPIRLPPGKKGAGTLLCNEQEVSQLKSIVGSLSWIARQCRPDLSYRVSRLQQRSSLGTATLADVLEANKVVAYTLATADRGLTFKANAVDWSDMCVTTITDASHSNEEAPVDGDRGPVEPYRSQAARLTVLASRSLIDTEQGYFHLIGHSSSTLKRVCRATLQAEAYSLQLGVEQGDVLRAALADMQGNLASGPSWEDSAAKQFQHLWITDCKSLESALVRPLMGRIADKRLGIELAAMRQSLWRRISSQSDAPDDLPEPAAATDLVRWTDTDCMIADPLTKVMEPIKLQESLDSNFLSLVQPVESLVKKRLKQAQRRKTTDPDPGLSSSPADLDPRLPLDPPSDHAP